MNEKNTTPKTGFEKILAFFNNDQAMNHPIAIAEVVERTGFSWSFVKKTLSKIKNDYDGFYFEKSGSTWMIWKDRNHIIKKLDDTCSRFLVGDEEEC